MDLDRLRKHYESLSDEALLDINRDELVAAACVVLDAEIAARGLNEAGAPQDEESEEPVAGEKSYETDWEEDALSVFAYIAQYADDGDRAIAALKAAAIPYQISTVEHSEGPSETEIKVPSKSWLEASSVLDRDVLNGQYEQNVRDHLAQLSDDDFAASDLDLLLAGSMDRVERMRRAYQEERAKRVAITSRLRGV